YLLGAQNAFPDQSPDHVMAYAKQLGGFRHRQPLAVLLGRAIGMDVVLVAQSTHALCIPGHALSGAHTHTIQRCGYVLIGPSTRHAAHDRKHLFRSAAAMLARSWLVEPQLRVLPSLPVDRQDDFPRLFIQ